MRSGGGGGYGDPLTRPAKDVAHDAKQEYISLRTARDYYGVVLDPETFAVDQDATAKLRAAMRAAPAVAKTA
jgi:N-methylhydantoinase B